MDEGVDTLDRENVAIATGPRSIVFRKPSKVKNVRKRTAVEEDDSEEDESSSVVFNKRKLRSSVDNKLSFSTGPAMLDSAGEKPPKASFFQYESSKEIQVDNDCRATATLETDTEFPRAVTVTVPKLAGKVFEKPGGGYGPLRASANVRVTSIVDYQPDICKDYKETGYCAYGDFACKFIHDRSDQKSGSQLEMEWVEKEKERKRRLAMGIDEEWADLSDENEENALPIVCSICKGTFVDAVGTICKHYFCEHCALKHHARNKKCFVCNKPTNGIFNAAFEIRKKIAAEGKRTA